LRCAGDRRHVTRGKLLVEGIERFMEYRNIEKIRDYARQLAPVSDEDIEQLAQLLNGVRDAADLMESLIQPFEGEVDVSKMSLNVDGDQS
tara:strand:+ start:8673 stop:8942 length:270 start_codon:yes stop_codon:yes gene_type:complete